MSSESAVAEMQLVLERLISSRNRDRSLFIPFLLGFTAASDPFPNSDHPDRDSYSPDDQGHSDQRDRIVLINPLTQGMVVIEGTRLDAMFRNSPEKQGQPPASKSAIDALPSVEIGEGDGGECVICLDEFFGGLNVKEMPCKHRFHGECIEKWLGMHGSCPVCRHIMPAEEEGGKKRDGEERDRRREIWVSFSFGGSRRRTEERDAGSGDHNRSGSGEVAGNRSEFNGERGGSQTEERESEAGN